MCLISLLLPAFVSASLCVGVIGDSISVPWPVDKENAWHSILAKKYDWKVINYSVGGSTTDTLMERMTDLIEKENPSIVFITLGINDGILGKPMQEIYKNLYLSIKYALDHNVEIFVGTVDISCMNWNGKEYSQHFKSLYNILHQHFRHKIHVFPFMTTPLMSMPEYFGSPDHFHPNELGHLLIANEVMKFERLWVRE